MREFHSPRTQLFSVWRFRRIVLPVVTITFVYATLSLFMPGPGHYAVASAPSSAAAAVRTAPVRATPRRIVMAPERGPATASLRELFTPPPPAGPTQKTLAVGSGDTLMDLLVRNDVPRGDAHEAIAALRKVYDPRKLRPSHKITVFYQPGDEGAALFNGLSIQKDIVSSVRVSREENGYGATEKDRPTRTESRAFRGNIDGSLYLAAKAEGVPDAIILDIIKIYSFTTDFQRDIHAGDSFEVMYDTDVTADSGEIVPGHERVTYAKLTLSGQDIPFYYFENSAGDDDYYGPDGKGAKKPLMKTPIDGARISSGFGKRRHPVLGYTKMHKGVDFAAPSGTPIYAAGDGTIEKLGPYSSYGNYIRIRHSGGIRTAYAHMKGFKSGLKSGSRVKQGQVIGYVGTTGRSTGPHLHYEVMMSGKQVNPATIKISGGKSLAGKDLKKFKTQVAEADRDFRTLVEGRALASLAAPATRGRVQ